ncbi:MAG: Methyltransferase [Rhodospirillales bacterium]|nr:Methyltransferase [Rhodospirillales bacterium]
MPEINLLRALPSSRRNVTARAEAKSQELVDIARLYGEVYFDGPREFGYGGYRYDGRWRPVARDMIAHFGLKPGMRVLDVGCAKGFLVKDLMLECPGLEVFGLDISAYALSKAETETIGRLHLGTAEDLSIFPDGAFEAVISLNTIHNLDRAPAAKALAEIQRVSRGKAFVQVDSYHTPAQKALFEDWVLTAKFHDCPNGWLALFEEAGYAGDYYWTVIQ